MGLLTSCQGLSCSEIDAFKRSSASTSQVLPGQKVGGESLDLSTLRAWEAGGVQLAFLSCTAGPRSVSCVTAAMQEAWSPRVPSIANTVKVFMQGQLGEQQSVQR